MSASSLSLAEAIPSRKRLLQVAALVWFAVIGIDLLLNAGLLARFYHWEQPGLLPPIRMFQYTR